MPTSEHISLPEPCTEMDEARRKKCATVCNTQLHWKLYHDFCTFLKSTTPLWGKPTKEHDRMCQMMWNCHQTWIHSTVAICHQTSTKTAKNKNPNSMRPKLGRKRQPLTTAMLNRKRRPPTGARSRERDTGNVWDTSRQQSFVAQKRTCCSLGQGWRPILCKQHQILKDNFWTLHEGLNLRCKLSFASTPSPTPSASLPPSPEFWGIGGGVGEPANLFPRLGVGWFRRGRRLEPAPGGF